MKHHIVYHTINIYTKKQYVGVHSTNNLNDGYIGSGSLLKKAIRQWGEQSFYTEILFNCDSRPEALWLEKIIIPQWLIEKWGNGKHFYNKIEGGYYNKYLEDEYKVKLRIRLNNQFILLERYEKSTTKVLHKCNICNYECKYTPTNILAGCYCKGCLATQRFEKYQKNLDSKFDGNLICKIKDKREFKNGGSYFHICLICNAKWKRTTSTILNYGCQICNGNKLNTKKYIYKLKEVGKEYIVPLEEYINAAIPIKHKCLRCDREWISPPHFVLANKYGCANCAQYLRNKNAYTIDEYIKELKKRNKSVIPIGEFINIRTITKHKCLECGHIRKVKPDYVLYKSNGNGCPRCYRWNTNNYRNDYYEKSN